MQIPQQSLRKNRFHKPVATSPSHTSRRNQANAKNDPHSNSHFHTKHHDCPNRHPLRQARHHPRPPNRLLQHPPGQPRRLRHPIHANIRRPLRPRLRENLPKMDEKPSRHHPPPTHGNRHDYPHPDHGRCFVDREVQDQGGKG